MVSPEIQRALFEPADPAHAADSDRARPRKARAVEPADASAEILELAAALRRRWGNRLRLGTSSWHFPGWAGSVWARGYSEAQLSREGLGAYARHALLRCVSLDRAFYRPLDAATYARLGAQVDEDFRFVVKAPSLISDATLREAGSGKPTTPNPHFLDPGAAVELCARPLAQGLRDRLGVLVVQLSPLPSRWRDDGAALHTRLAGFWQALMPELPAHALVALEVRDPELLTPELAGLLREHGVHYCLGLHDRMPDAASQLPMLRAAWPADFVCRWNLQRGQRYAEARDRWAPFDRLRSPDLATRDAIARVARATLEAGHLAFVTINNKAEGSAPASVIELARALV